MKKNTQLIKESSEKELAQKPKKTTDVTVKPKKTTKISSSKEVKKRAVKKIETKETAKPEIKTAVAKTIKSEKKTEPKSVAVKPNVLPIPRMELERQRLAEYQDESRNNDDYMNEEQKAHFRKILEDWRDDIISDGQKHVQSLREEREPVADLNDRATLEEEFSLELRTRDRERRALNKIEKALKRIENDTFGYCEKCGDEIGVNRLEARPTAELCIDCKEIAEHIEKNYIH